MADKVISVRLRALTDQYEAAMRRAGAATRGLRDNADQDIKALGQTMTQAGRSMTVGLTLPIAAGVAFAIRETVNFESAMAGVAKTIDLTDAEFASMAQGIRDMAMELPASREEIAAVAEAAGQLGIQKANILDFTRTMIDLGESTNLTADEAATAFAQLANVTQMPQDEFGALGDTLVALGNAGASTEADILELGQRLAAAGSQAGLTEAEILGLGSAMADVGINAEMGGTSMSQVLTRMRDAAIDGGPHLEAFADAAGLTADQFARLFEEDPDQAISSFVEGLARITEEGGTMTPVMEGIGLSGERVRDTLGRLAGAGDGVAESFARANNEFGGGALAEEAARRYATNASKMEVSWNKITDAVMEAGEVLVPIVVGITDGIADLAGVFADLPGPVQAALIALLGLVAVAGPLIWAAGTATTAWATLGTTLPAVATGATTAAAGIRLALSAISAGHPGILAATVALGALAAILNGNDFSTGLTPEELDTEAVDGLTASMVEAGDAAEGLLAHWNESADSSFWEALGVGPEEFTEALLASDAAYQQFRDSVLSDMPTDQVDRWGDALDLHRERALAAAGAWALIPVDPAEEMARAAEEAAESVRDLEEAWSGLNNLLSDTEAQAQARMALRDLKAEAMAMLDGGVTPDEMDQLRVSTAGYARTLEEAAEAANTNAAGVLNARGAQRDLLASMRAVRDEIPVSMIPMWDRMIRELGRPATLSADGEPARREIDMTTERGRRQWARRFTASLDATIQQALDAIAEATRAGEAFARRSFVAHLDIAAGPGANADGTLGLGGHASGGLIRATPGGRAIIAGEGGFDEVVVSTDPKYHDRSMGLLSEAGLLPSPGLVLASGSTTTIVNTNRFYVVRDNEAIVREAPTAVRAKARAHLNGRR